MSQHTIGQRPKTLWCLLLLWLVISLIFLTTVSMALAQGGGNTTLSWWTIDNGGGESAGGGYSIAGTIGQPDAGILLSGGQFTLQGGFWTFSNANGLPAGPQSVYLPLILR